MSATQKALVQFSRVAGIGAFDSAAVVRFINDAINQRPIDTADAGHAALLLNALIQGVRHGEDIDPSFRRLLRVRKKRNNKFDPDSAYIDSTAFDIVLQLEQRRISLKEAIEAFNAHVVEADEKSIRSWIKAIQPRARQIVELFATQEKK